MAVVHLSARHGASEMQLSLSVEKEVWDKNTKMVVCNEKSVHATVIYLLVQDVDVFEKGTDLFIATNSYLHQLT